MMEREPSPAGGRTRRAGRPARGRRVSVGVGQLVAALFRPAASPVIAVGNRLILLTPEPVKRWAIREFGTGDKHALLTGIYLALAGCAVLIGMVAVRRLRLGLVGVGAARRCSAVYCALTAAAPPGAATRCPRCSARWPGWLPGLAGGCRHRGRRRRQRAVPPGEQAAPAAGRTGGGSCRVAGGRRAGRWSAASAAGRCNTAGSTPTAARARSGCPSRCRTGQQPRRGRVGRRSSFDLGKSGVPFQTPADKFYRIDTALVVPQIDPDTWSLQIHGMVDQPS